MDNTGPETYAFETEEWALNSNLDIQHKYVLRENKIKNKSVSSILNYKNPISRLIKQKISYK